MQNIIYGLSNETYHRGEDYREYLSSTQLKWYLKSPRHFRHMLDHPEDETDAMRFGSLFHDCLAALAEGCSLSEVLSAIAGFEPPVNDRTGQPYGATTKAYKKSLEAFSTEHNGAFISSAAEKDTISQMLNSMLCGCGATSKKIQEILRRGKPEASIFVEYKGCKFKLRPDLLDRYKQRGDNCADIYDWKSVATDDLSAENINRIILRYAYHISSSFYQFFYHELTGIWPRFILVLANKAAPFDCVMVDMANYGYRYQPIYDMVVPGPGAVEFKRLLDLHLECTATNNYPGAEMFSADNKCRILEIEPPKYYSNKFIEDY